jgi:hypothetical protein
VLPCPGRNVTVVTGHETVRQFRSGELHDLNCISTVVTLTKWRRVGLARYVARIQDLRNVFMKTKFYSWEVKKQHLGDLGVNERIILKPILKI